MQTAPSRGRLAEEKSGVREHVLFSKPQGSLQQKSHAARQRLVRLNARLDALCVWRDDIQARIEHAKQLFERGSLYPDQLEDLQDAVRAWRLAAAGVVLELNGADDMRRSS